MEKKTVTDLRYIKTENLIRNTFCDMLHDMDYPQISIKDLISRAMINRKTFYLHYNSLDHLLETMQAELYDSLFQSLSEISFPEDVEILVRELYTFCDKTDHIEAKILYSHSRFTVNSTSEKSVGSMVFDYCHLNETLSRYSKVEKDIFIAYFDGCISSIYSKWIADDKKIPVNDIIKLTSKLIMQGFSSLDFMK